MIKNGGRRLREEVITTRSYVRRRGRPCIDGHSLLHMDSISLLDGGPEEDEVGQWNLNCIAAMDGGTEATLQLPIKFLTRCISSSDPCKGTRMVIKFRINVELAIQEDFAIPMRHDAKSCW